MWSFKASRSDFRHKKHLLSFSGRTVHDSSRMGESWGSFSAETRGQSRTSGTYLTVVDWLTAPDAPPAGVDYPEPTRT